MSNQINPVKWAALPPEAQINLEALQRKLDLYLAEMTPGKPLEAERGMEMQLQLWKAIKDALKKEGSEFVAHYSTLLQTVHAHRRTGAFNERYVYRYFQNLRMPAAERRNFERMLNLMLTTADPSTRRLALRQINLPTTLSGFEDEGVRQRVTDYYMSF